MINLVRDDPARFRIVLSVCAGLRTAKLTQASGAVLSDRGQHPVDPRRILPPESGHRF
ncbi:MAG: hypothetical protein QOD67_3692 [Caballeronia sp.]|jgi:hypothetical protein|nr:hypothetical protein [Caballeronia sp.]